MSGFMFVMFEGGGNVPVQLAIARRLVARGHRVRVLGDAASTAQASGAGCEVATFATAPHQDLRDHARDQVRDWDARTPMASFARFGNAVMFGPAERYARDVLGELEREPVDALAVDCLLFGAMIGAERSGLPTAQLHHMPYALPAPGLPPFGMGLHPARGPLGWLRDRLLGAAGRRMFEKVGRAPVNAARIALGMDPLASVYDQARRQDRVLVLTSRGFDLASRATLPANVVFVGPQLDDPAWAEAWTPPWPAGAREPLVLVALGSTFQNQRAVIQRVIDALAGLPVRGLVTLGGVFEPSELTLPANVVAVASAPHQRVLPAAKLVIAHGGHGTVIKALAHGVPVLCIPLGRDQADNAARVEVAGAGLRARKASGVGALRDKIRRLIAEPAFAASARTLATEIAADVAEDRAVAELEALATATHLRAPAPAHAFLAQVAATSTA